MTKKTFTWHLKERKFNELKAVNNNILKKSFVRDFLEEDKTVKVIDNFSGVSDILLKKEESNKYKIGTSIKTKDMILKSIYWDKLQLTMPFLLKPLIHNRVERIKADLITLQKKEKKGKEIIPFTLPILRKPGFRPVPVKGGFIIKAISCRNLFFHKTRFVEISINEDGEEEQVYIHPEMEKVNEKNRLEKELRRIQKEEELRLIQKEKEEKERVQKEKGQLKGQLNGIEEFFKKQTEKEQQEKIKKIQKEEQERLKKERERETMEQRQTNNLNRRKKIENRNNKQKQNETKNNKKTNIPKPNKN